MSKEYKQEQETHHCKWWTRTMFLHKLFTRNKDKRRRGASFKNSSFQGLPTLNNYMQTRISGPYGPLILALAEGWLASLNLSLVAPPPSHPLLVGSNRRKAELEKAARGACGNSFQNWGHFAKELTHKCRNFGFVRQMLSNEAYNPKLKVGMILKSSIWGWKWGKIR